MFDDLDWNQVCREAIRQRPRVHEVVGLVLIAAVICLWIHLSLWVGLAGLILVVVVVTLAMAIGAVNKQGASDDDREEPTFVALPTDRDKGEGDSSDAS